MKSLCVEGWRFIPHSYAMVNQWQLLSLLKCSDIALTFRDITYYGHKWKETKALLNIEDENKLASIPTLASGRFADVTYRIAFPYNFFPVAKGHTVVFGTAEYQVVDQTMFSGPIDVYSLSNSDSFFVVTPSRWSREGFLRLGLRHDQVIVIPHGVATNIFYPLRLMREHFRQKFKLSGFIFANASAMTRNKGIDVLLRAFAVVAEKRPDVRLLLKGTDMLYPSKFFLMQILSTLPLNQQNLIRDKICYLGSTFSVAEMAEFYQAADAYISPYRAEGFNLPILESLACGTPVICTKGGATDDFLDDQIALLIESELQPVKINSISTSGVQLEPNLDHLIQLMFRVMDDDTWRLKASIAGVNNVTRKFDWDRIVDKLLVSIFKGRGSKLST